MDDDIQKVIAGFHSVLKGMRIMYYTGRVAGQKRNAVDCSPLELHVIRHIAEAGGSKPLLEIRKLLDLPNSTLSSLFKRLIQHKLVTKSPSADDRRTYIISLTPLGHRINRQHYLTDCELAANFIRLVDNQKEVAAFIRSTSKMNGKPLVSSDFLKNLRAEKDE